MAATQNSQFFCWNQSITPIILIHCSSGIDQTEVFFDTQVAFPKTDPTGAVAFTVTRTTVYETDISLTRTGFWKTIFNNADVLFSSGLHSIGVGTINQIAVCISDKANVKPAEVVYTTDNGLTWDVTNIRQTFPTWSFPQSPLWVGSNLYVCSGYDQFVSPAAVNGGLFFASFTTRDFGPRVIMSSDGGLTWKDMSKGLPSLPVTRLVSDSNTLYIYAATYAGVYISTNSGSSWTRFGTSLPNVPVKDMYVSPNKLQIATFGRGVWETNLSSISTPNSETGTSSNLSAGAVAGIVIGVFVFFVFAVALFYFYICKPKQDTSTTNVETINSFPGDVGIDKVDTQLAIQTSDSYPSGADFSKV